MMNQPKLPKHGFPQAQPAAQPTVDVRPRAWTFAPSADEEVTWPLSLEVEPWRP